MIRVLIADDHPLIRSGLTDLLAATGDVHVVAECSDGCDVVDAAAESHPDVVLMDLVMPVLGGLAATRALREAQPNIRVIVLTGSISGAAVREAHALGVCGFLLKTDDLADALPGHIRAVAAGGTAWNPVAAQAVAAGGSA
jgi:DNA-binding NarL/FixJ family response regulator